MIKVVNITLSLALVTLIATLYHIRYSAEAEAKAVRHLERKIAEEEDRRRTLRAEWASLNDPRRLQMLTRQYLSLDYLRASQVLDLRDDEPRSIPIVLSPVARGVASDVAADMSGGVDEPQ